MPKTFDVPRDADRGVVTVQPSSVAYVCKHDMSELTEINFVGGVAAIRTALSLREVRNLLDEALRYNA